MTIVEMSDNNETKLLVKNYTSKLDRSCFETWQQHVTQHKIHSSTLGSKLELPVSESYRRKTTSWTLHESAVIKAARK